MLGEYGSLSRVLAVRMAAISALLSLVLMALFVLYYLSDEPLLRQMTLRSSAQQIAQMLIQKENPASVNRYREYPGAYGFRVFDNRLVAKRHLLASANTDLLVKSLGRGAVSSRSGSNLDPVAQHKDFEESFTHFVPSDSEAAPHQAVYLLTDRVVISGYKYWIQVFMRGDPGWAGARVIASELFERVLLPVLFIVPALTLAMFLSIRRSLLPLQALSKKANSIGHAVAQGQSPVPLPEAGMAREFTDVAAAINKMLAKLSQSMQSHKQFVSDAAHELRTPLAILLLEAGQLPPSPTKKRLKDDLKALGALVNELLRFAQAEEVLARTLERVDVAAIAQKVSREVAVAAITSEQSIELNCPNYPITMSGNVTLIEIAIRNLVENALKYSSPQTTITVSVQAGPMVIVEDCGPGIPAAQRNTIFERFWRADPKSGSGAGVGLALVRRIAELHDGRIVLEDRPGGGSRFVLSFALATVA